MIDPLMLLPMASRMTLRDWYAGMAIQRLEPPFFMVGDAETAAELRRWATHAWQMADAILDARKDTE